MNSSKFELARNIIDKLNLFTFFGCGEEFYQIRNNQLKAFNCVDVCFLRDHIADEYITSNNIKLYSKFDVNL